MKNEFSKNTKELFDRWGYMMDFEDWRNDANVLHHILGRYSNTPYNAVSLNNNRNHMPEGRKWKDHINSDKVKKKYLLSVMSYLESIWYVPTDKDREFMGKNKKYYKWITF